MAKKETNKTQEVEPAKVRRELNPFGDMERMFDEFFPRHLMRHWGLEQPRWPEFKIHHGMQSLRVDVIDRENEILVRAEMPGIQKDDINVSLAENSVTIKGDTNKEEKEDEGDYHRCEILHGSFSRTVALPAYVDSKKAKAKFKDGILELTLPKTENTKRMELKIEG
ncbi:MAG: Hsp20/alpha crystallin family protein [Amphritea sp.]